MSIYSDKQYRAKRAALKQRVARYRLPCVVCSEPIDLALRAPHPRSFSADHVTEISAGGDLLGELQPTHLGCNSARGARFKAARQRKRFDSNRYTGEKLPWL